MGKDNKVDQTIDGMLDYVFAGSDRALGQLELDALGEAANTRRHIQDDFEALILVRAKQMFAAWVRGRREMLERSMLDNVCLGCRREYVRTIDVKSVPKSLPPLLTRHKTSFRLSPEARRLLQRLAQDLGTSQTGALEQIIREAARALRIKP